MRLITRKLEDEDVKFLAAFEEALYTSVSEGMSENTIWFHRNQRCLYLSFNSSLLYADTDYARELKIPITRRKYFVGKKTSIVLGGTGFTLDIYAKNIGYEKINNDYCNGFWNFVMRDLIDIETKGNDIVIKGTDRKIVGSISSNKENMVAVTSLVLEKLPSDIDLERLFKMPEEKFIDKEVNSVEERMTSLYSETGQTFDDAILKEKAIEYFESIGETIKDETDFNEHEYDLVDKLREKHISEEWIKYARISTKPDFI